MGCLKQEGDEGKDKLKALRNIYNRGFIANFREVFLCIDVHSLALQVNEENVNERNAGEAKPNEYTEVSCSSVRKDAKVSSAAAGSKTAPEAKKSEKATKAKKQKVIDC